VGFIDHILSQFGPFQSVTVWHWWLLTPYKSVSVIYSGDLVTVAKSVSCIQKSIGNQMILNRLSWFPGILVLTTFHISEMLGKSSA